jgi:hypothetical protein
MKSLFTVLIGCCMLTDSIEAQILLSEIMADPVGSEFRNEYIELVNVGVSPVDLAGWAISDGASHDVLVFRGPSVLPAGALCLVFDPDYEEGKRPYGVLTASLLATVEDRSLGNGGLDNGVPEPVYLIEASGDTADVVEYPPNLDGFSFERVVGLEPRWAVSKWSGGTPGSLNSVSPKQHDLELTLLEGPSTSLPGGAIQEVVLVVKSRGTLATAAEVRVTWAEELWVSDIGSIAAGETARVHFPQPPTYGRRVTFLAEMVSEFDEDPTNDQVTWSVRFGGREGSVVINEIMAIPEEGREWVEIYNPSESTIDLQDWMLLDAAGRAGKIPEAHIEAGGYLVLAKEARLSDGWVQVTPWPSLNNSGDTVIIQDAVGMEIDAMSYSQAVPGKSIERIDPRGASGDHSNWLVNALDPDGTPGSENRSIAGTSASISLSADPDPFTTSTSVRATLPNPRSFVTLQVFDRRGRLRRSILRGVEVGATLDVPWDGLDDRGVHVKPGAYVLVLEHSGADNRIFQARTVVNYAKGL